MKAFSFVVVLFCLIGVTACKISAQTATNVAVYSDGTIYVTGDELVMDGANLGYTGDGIEVSGNWNGSWAGPVVLTFNKEKVRYEGNLKLGKKTPEKLLLSFRYKEKDGWNFFYPTQQVKTNPSLAADPSVVSNGLTGENLGYNKTVTITAGSPGN